MKNFEQLKNRTTDPLSTPAMLDLQDGITLLYAKKTGNATTLHAMGDDGYIIDLGGGTPLEITNFNTFNPDTDTRTKDLTMGQRVQIRSFQATGRPIIDGLIYHAWCGCLILANTGQSGTARIWKYIVYSDALPSVETEELFVAMSVYSNGTRTAWTIPSASTHTHPNFISVNAQSLLTAEKAQARTNIDAAQLSGSNTQDFKVNKLLLGTDLSEIESVRGSSNYEIWRLKVNGAAKRCIEFGMTGMLYYDYEEDKVYNMVTDQDLKNTTATLTAAGWTGSSAPFSQTLTVSGIGISATSSQVTTLFAQSVSSVAAWTDGNIMASESAQSANTIVYSAWGTKPTVDLDIKIIKVSR